ncbi:hypothetical protein GCM10018781_55880 [Kitasatospora indigofera]|uniref:Uncharacterized protein n=1 Tax=Kitasatospora indigofera TaxID=67307 RepID=A0A919G729_9ACTN|nr:hypothetical protein [Kitasatospora indigofera]GHH78959.1 hypothetical protein GCM10018781_55880 [Kitasatospora indigofera]
MSAAQHGGALPADPRSLTWARYLAGPLPLKALAAGLDRSRDSVEAELSSLAAAAGVSGRSGVVARYVLAGHLTAENFPPTVVGVMAGLSGEERLLLRLLAGTSSRPAIGMELGIARPTAGKRLAALLDVLGVREDHEAVALGCLAGIVRPADVVPQSAPAVPPAPPEHLRDLVGPVCEALTCGRAMVRVPRCEQPDLATAIAWHTDVGRVLVVVPPGTSWNATVTAFAEQRRERGAVVAVLHRDEAARPAIVTPLDVPQVTAASAVLECVGSTLPATVIVSPRGLEIVAEAYRRAQHLVPYDLIVALDAHLPAVAGRVGRHECCPPGRAILWLSSTPVLTSVDRDQAEGVDPDRTGPLVAKLTPRQSVAAGRMRDYRLMAAALPPGGTRTERLAALVLNLASTQDLSRVVVHCATSVVARRLADEITGSTGPDLQAHVLPQRGGQREQVLRAFALGTGQLQILVTAGQLPAGLDADALVHATANRPVTHTTEMVEAALAPGRPGAGALLAVAADGAEDGQWPALAELTGAFAALDPDLRTALHHAREDRPTEGWDGLTFAVPLADADQQRRARAVSAWADTTIALEMQRTAARSRLVHGVERPDVLSPTGQRLGAWMNRRRHAQRAPTHGLPVPRVGGQPADSRRSVARRP